MTTITNTLEGGTSGATVTPANSGGGSGTAFDNVVNAPTYNNSSPINGLMSLLFSGTTNQNVTWIATLPAGSTGYSRIVGKMSALPGANASIMEFRKANGTSIGTDIRVTPTGGLQIRPAQVTQITTADILTAGTLFRIEIHLVSSATVGHVEGRVYVGANVWGSTPDLTFGNMTTNYNTGDGTIGGFATGWIVTPTGNPTLRLDEIGYSDTTWLGSPVSSVVYDLVKTRIGMWGNKDRPAYSGGGGGGGSAFSSLLVPSSGALFGVTAASVASDGGSTSTAGLAEWTAATGQRPHVISIYKTGAWNGVFTTAEAAYFDPGGGAAHAIPFLHWKINSGGATWAQVGSGARDTDIDNFCTGIKTYGRKCFMTLHHEPEDNVGGAGSGMTKADYKAMWTRFKARCVANSVTNLVFVIQYVGYSADAVNSVGQGFEDMYPGDDIIDWIGWDPYNKTNPARTTWGQIVNENIAGTSGWTGFYNWATTRHPSKPLMICETGAGITFNGAMTPAQAATCYNGWAATTEDFPQIRAVVFWNSKAAYDYFITKSGREVAATAVTNWLSLPWFDQNPNLAP